jgi:hypothetical protein
MTRDEHGFDENGLLEGEVELWRNAQWRVTTLALEEADKRPTCWGPYWIAVREIHGDNWSAHMAEKNWVDINLFNEALTKARELHPQEQAA